MFDVLSGLAKPDKVKNAVCVWIDVYHRRFEFYKIEEGNMNTLARDGRIYKSKLYSPEFLKELTEAASSYTKSNPVQKDVVITLVLPDNAVAMDTVNIPNMNRRRNDDAFDSTMSSLYKNRKELKFNSVLATQNKNVAVYSVSLINDKLYSSLYDALTDGGLAPKYVTFDANARVNAFSQLCSKHRNSSYILLDIKHHTSGFSFVAKGRTTGFFDLPFGYSILHKSRVASEDMLFEHTTAELAVLNAQEKAKAKQLTMMQNTPTDQTEENEDGEKEEQNLDAMFGGDENATVDPTLAGVQPTIKVLPKKAPRKLPKFMLRDIPTDEEGYGYENFRIFVKWALNLIQSNEKLISQGKPDCIYVNMPEDLKYLFDKVNEEAHENGIEFKPLDIQENVEGVNEIFELFGGLFTSIYNKTNNF